MQRTHQYHYRRRLTSKSTMLTGDPLADLFFEAITYLCMKETIK